MLKRLSILLLMLTTTTISMAANRYFYKSLTMSDGLPDNIIFDITQDGDGFYWFATADWLCRYDGHAFHQYRLRHIGTGTIHAESDARGRLWMQDCGKVLTFDTLGDSLTTNVASILHLSEKQQAELRLSFVDEDRNLWIVSGNKLIYYNIANGGKAEPYTPMASIQLPTGDDVVWVNARDGMAYAIFRSGKLCRINLTEHQLINVGKAEVFETENARLYIDYSGTMWVYMKHGASDVLTRYDQQVRRLVTFQTSSGERLQAVTCVRDDGRGNLWVGTDSRGLCIIRQADGAAQWERIEGASLLTNHIRSLYLDRQGTMWIGSSKRGVAYTSLQQQAVRNLRVPPTADINAIAVEQNGTLWLGLDGDGLMVSTDQSPDYTTLTTADGLPSGTIISSCIDRKGRLWLGTFGGGLFRMDGRRAIPLQLHGERTEKAKYIRCISPDDDGNLWIGTVVDGLYRVNPENGQTTFHEHGIHSYSITDICMVDGETYIATPSGLSRLPKDSKEALTVEDSMLSKASITGMDYDGQGHLWLATNSGLCLYDTKTGHTQCITEADGLSHNYVRAVCIDLKGNVWATTDRGFSHVVREKDGTLSCHRYFRREYFGDIAFNLRAICCTPQGKVIMGGAGGAVVVEPDAVSYDEGTGRVFFTDLIIGKDTRRLHQQQLTLGYDENTFAIAVASPESATRRATYYEYRFKGDKQWNELSDNVIYFNRLPSGHYDLQVRVAGTTDESDIAELRLTIRPPFWRSTVAIIFYVLLVVSILIQLLYLYRRRQQEKLRTQRLELEMKNQKELEESQLVFFTNISHDLRTPLSLIITPIERLLSLRSDKDVMHPTKEMVDSNFRSLEMIHRNASLLMDEVNQLLDFRKLTLGRQELRLTIGDIAVFIREVCNTVSHSGLGKKSIRMNVVLKEPNIPMSYDRSKMQRILMNLLSNAYKFTGDGGTITVTVERRRPACTPVGHTTADSLQIRVADTGPGIPDAEKHLIFERFYQNSNAQDHVGSGIGLHIVNEFTALMGGTVHVEDNEPHGAVFVVEVPIHQDVQEGEQPTMIQADAENPDNIATETSPSDSNTAPILVVEDNADFRSFISDCLSPHYQVLTAENGQQALDIMARRPVRLVISDIMMPVMDGLELCNAIKGNLQYSHIPVILLTARSAQEYILEGLQEGADEYITKPFNLNILLLRIEKLLSWSSESQQKFVSKIDIAPSEITISSLDEQLISKAIKEVEAHMDDSEYTVEQLGEALGMTRGHLYKKLMAITGKSPLEFIRILRLKRGRQLLEQSQYNVSEIAYMVGFSPKVFSKHFKDMYGQLPTEFRQAGAD